MRVPSDITFRFIAHTTRMQAITRVASYAILTHTVGARILRAMGALASLTGAAVRAPGAAGGCARSAAAVLR